MQLNEMKSGAAKLREIKPNDDISIVKSSDPVMFFAGFDDL